MFLSRLGVLHVRNLQDVQISLGPGLNIFIGANGSGKSSILESVHLLARGKSFRTREVAQVITNSERELVVSGRLQHSGSEGQYQLGVRRTRDGQFEARCNGQTVVSSSDLAQLLPLQSMDVHSMALLEGGPAIRRQFLDWGVFHVERSYRDLWRRFQKALKQRNELLRHDKIDADLLRLWTAELVPVSEQITQLRRRYLSDFLEMLARVLQYYPGFQEIEVSFYLGWDKSRNFAEVLEENCQRDKDARRTLHGPHRADLRIKINGTPVSETLSRGQLKVVVSALKIAQSRLFAKRRNETCIFLIDDLPSELDEQNAARVIDLLASMNSQLLVTAIDRRYLPSFSNHIEQNTFHVEHGSIRSPSYS